MSFSDSDFKGLCVYIVVHLLHAVCFSVGPDVNLTNIQFMSFIFYFCSFSNWVGWGG